MTWDIVTLVEETNLPEKKLLALRALDKKLKNHEEILTEEEKSDIQLLLVESIGDMETNKKLDTINQCQSSDSGIDKSTANMIKDVSYRTRHFEKILPKMDEIYHNFEQAKAGKSLNENEKISLSQYGILYDLANLNKKLQALDEQGLIQGNPKLEALYQRTQQAATIIKHLDDTFDKTFKAPAGSIGLDDVEKRAQIYGKKVGFFQMLIKNTVNKFGHASKVISAQEGDEVKNKMSHINPDYKEEKFSLRNFLYTDVYKIKIESLIDPKTQDLLQKHYGDDWREQLEQKYAAIEREIHDQALMMHTHIDVDGSKKRKGEIASALAQGGHKNFFSFDHSSEDVRDNVFGRGKWQESVLRDQTRILCSEFVGMTVIAAVQELNDNIKQELIDKGATDVPDRLIKSPISKREKLHLLTPERLLTAMQERGTVERVAAPNEINNFVATTQKAPSAMKKEITEIEQVITGIEAQIQKANQASVPLNADELFHNLVQLQEQYKRITLMINDLDNLDSSVSQGTLEKLQKKLEDVESLLTEQPQYEHLKTKLKECKESALEKTSEIHSEGSLTEQEHKTIEGCIMRSNSTIDSRREMASTEKMLGGSSEEPRRELGKKLNQLATITHELAQFTNNVKHKLQGFISKFNSPSNSSTLPSDAEKQTAAPIATAESASTSMRDRFKSMRESFKEQPKIPEPVISPEPTDGYEETIEMKI